MSTATMTVKRHNHRVHPCDRERKPELLNLLFAQYAGQSILVVTANDPEPLQEMVTGENITVISDTALADAPELMGDLLISYDLPTSADAYLARLGHAKTHALILLDAQEQKGLYPIETLLGRTTMQETISGFEPAPLSTPERQQKAFKAGQDRKRDNKTVRDDKRPSRRSASDEKVVGKSDKWAKKERQPSRYMGKDENGKPIFSDKTRERNHRYDGTPKDDADKAAKKRDNKNPWGSAKGERKPYGAGPKKQSKTHAAQNDANTSAPKRPPRKISIKSLKMQKESE